MNSKKRLFRILNETTEKFRQLCNDFDNQNVALTALISAYGSASEGCIDGKTQM